MSAYGAVLIAMVVPGGLLVALACATGWRWLGWAGIAAAVAGYGTSLVLALVRRDWAEAAADAGALILIAAIIWRRYRPDRAARSYGAKSWARLVVLLRRGREALRRRPALRPMPGGAR